MPKFERLIATNARILRKGVLQLDTPTVGLSHDYHNALKLRGSFPGKSTAEIVQMIRRDTTGNAVILKIGAGAREIGFNPGTWFFVLDGRAYVRPPGNGQRGHYYRSGGRWHTNVRALRGKQKTAVMSALAVS